jgi:hypothetical protein
MVTTPRNPSVVAVRRLTGPRDRCLRPFSARLPRFWLNGLGIWHQNRHPLAPPGLGRFSFSRRLFHFVGLHTSRGRVKSGRRCNPLPTSSSLVACFGIGELSDPGGAFSLPSPGSSYRSATTIGQNFEGEPRRLKMTVAVRADTKRDAVRERVRRLRERRKGGIVIAVVEVDESILRYLSAGTRVDVCDLRNDRTQLAQAVRRALSHGMRCWRETGRLDWRHIVKR